MEALRIAIQKSGRLSEDSLKIFKECGIKFNNGAKKLKAISYNYPIEFLFLRDDDIPGYVEDSIADLGIVGENEVAEKDKATEIIKKLGFSKCRLSLAIPKSSDYSDINFFHNKSIATSYPNILSKYLERYNIRAEIHEISGSVEIAPSIGLADGICDLVSSGSTLLINGLKEVETIFKSEAVLIGPKKVHNQEKLQLIEKLLFRIDSVLIGKNNKYILLNAPNEKLDDIIKVLPGMRSPTVLPLASHGWSSVHSVVKEDEFWEIIHSLKAEGAEGILVVPIEKMIL